MLLTRAFCLTAFLTNLFTDFKFDSLLFVLVNWHTATTQFSLDILLIFDDIRRLEQVVINRLDKLIILFHY